MGSKFNLVVVAHDLPFPANHGGRVDMWNRIRAMSHYKDLIDIHLVSWGNTENNDIINNYVKSSYFFNRSKSIKRLTKLKLPFSVTSCSVEEEKYKKMLELYKKNNVNLILLDGLAGVQLAWKLSNDLGIPYIYRSHNVEYEYVNGLYSSETNLLKRIKYKVDAYRTYFLEKLVRNESLRVYDISVEDNNKWSFPKSSEILYPSLINNINEKDKSINTKTKLNDYDVVYIGNLYTPNNLYGVKWFLNKVVPQLQGFNIVMAGSNPTEEIKTLCKQQDITLIENPDTLDEIYDRAKVLVNPIFHGSGINIKMIEMLSTGKKVVSTSVGARALPNEIKKFVKIADTPVDFIKEIKKNRLSETSNEQIDSIKEYFGWSNIEKFIKELILLTNRN